MRILVLAVGRIKDRAYSQMCDDYLRRIQRHCAVEVREVKSSEGLLKQLAPTDLVVAMEVDGQGWTSSQFAGRVQQWVESGRPRLVFLIGGAEGLPSQVSADASVRMSLSSLTLPHRLARVLLLEQLYRAFSIWRGEPYARED